MSLTESQCYQVFLSLRGQSAAPFQSNGKKFKSMLHLRMNASEQIRNRYGQWCVLLFILYLIRIYISRVWWVYWFVCPLGDSQSIWMELAAHDGPLDGASVSFKALKGKKKITWITKKIGGKISASTFVNEYALLWLLTEPRTFTSLQMIIPSLSSPSGKEWPAGRLKWWPRCQLLQVQEGTSILCLWFRNKMSSLYSSYVLYNKTTSLYIICPDYDE